MSGENVQLCSSSIYVESERNIYTHTHTFVYRNRGRKCVIEHNIMNSRLLRLISQLVALHSRWKLFSKDKKGKKWTLIIVGQH